MILYYILKKQYLRIGQAPVIRFTNFRAGLFVNNIFPPVFFFSKRAYKKSVYLTLITSDQRNAAVIQTPLTKQC